MSVEVTVQGFDELAARLSSLNIVDIASPVVTKAGVEIKKRMRADAAGHKHAPRLAQSISFDLKRSMNTVEVQVGPRRGSTGSLAMYWLGNAKMMPALPHPDRYAKEQAAQTVTHLVRALKVALR